MVAADFEAYAKAQREIDQLWTTPSAWYSKAVRNHPPAWAGSRPIARSGNMPERSGEPDDGSARQGPSPRPSGMLPAPEIAAILSGTHSNPSPSLRSCRRQDLYRPVLRAGRGHGGRETLSGKELGRSSGATRPVFFEGPVALRKEQPIRYRARNDRPAEWTVIDPYSFGPVLGPMDDYYIREGSHLRLFDKMGAHPIKPRRRRRAFTSPSGRRTPAACRWSAVSTTGTDDGTSCACAPTRASGIFIPGVPVGTPYKYEIVDSNGTLLPLKADPFARRSELRPDHGFDDRRRDRPGLGGPRRIVVTGRDGSGRRQPISIYEVHAASWQRRDNGDMLTWDELAERLIPIASIWASRTIEFLPISEYPL